MMDALGIAPYIQPINVGNSPIWHKLISHVSSVFENLDDTIPAGSASSGK